MYLERLIHISRQGSEGLCIFPGEAAKVNLLDSNWTTVAIAIIIKSFKQGKWRDKPRRRQGEMENCRRFWWSNWE